MKYTFAFAGLLCLVFSSCKKTYTCECFTNVIYYSPTDNTYYSEIVPGNKLAYGKKLTEKQAKAACQHEELSTQTNFTNWYTDNGRFQMYPGESINTSCGLK